MNDRTRQILKLVIDAYVETGAPVGSATISQKLGMRLSPATIRAVMAELEARGLLYAPHTSAGRLPTDQGLAVFVDGLLELDTLTPAEEEAIRARLRDAGGDVYEAASGFLSGLSAGAGLVFAPKTEDPVRQVEFVPLAPGRVLAVLVMASGLVENRIFDADGGVTGAELARAANYLNDRLGGRTLAQAAENVRVELAADRAQLDALTARVVESGIASLIPRADGGRLIVRGQGRLLSDITALEDLERIRSLFDALEAKETMLRLLQETAGAEGVKIFIGAENKLFNHAGCTMIVSPCRTEDARIVGAIGVIGPARMNYGRIIPVVNYTAQVVSRIVGLGT